MDKILSKAVKDGSKKSVHSPKEALGEYPFPVKRDDLVDGHDSTKQLGEVAATADNLTDGNDFSLIDNPVESPDVKQISVEEAGPVGAQDSSEQVSTGPAEASTLARLLADRQSGGGPQRGAVHGQIG